jgi:hypothetical protein
MGAFPSPLFSMEIKHMVVDSISERLNKPFHFQSWMFLLFFGIGFCPSLSRANPYAVCLSIRNPDTNQTLYTKPIKPGDEFIYAYTHSVEKLPVYETLTINENMDIILTETKLRSLSASGDILAQDERLILTRQYAIIKSQRLLKRISLRVAYFYKQKIIFQGEEIELQELAEPGASVEISLDRSCL